MQEWYEVSLGVRKLQDPSDVEAIQWMTLHGEMLSTLHTSWCRAAHGSPQSEEERWGHFRGHLASMIYTSWTIYGNEFSIPEFWEEWGKNEVLARPGGSSRRGLQGFPEVIPGIPVQWEPG